MENEKMDIEKEIERLDTERWIEVFSDGSVWELQKIFKYLVGKKMYKSVSGLPWGEVVVDNGVFDLTMKAKIMGLIPVVVVE